MSGVKDWAKRGHTLRRIERFEAYFSGYGFEPHRHDTYAVGRTLAGVHNFNYRKSMRHNLPGGTIVLHPDELHDGEAGTEDGFQYRIVYIEPALLQQALGGKPLPFITDGLSRDPRLYQATQVLMQGMDTLIDPLEEDDALYDLAQALAAVAGMQRGRKSLDFIAAERAREYIHSALERVVTLDELEQASGRDRWSLSRDFRALYGTSPYRYLTMRRLDHVRVLMVSGVSIADAALIAGFTDQSHMTQHFTRTYGLPPARWLRMIRPA
ncbi:AraC family transcriptional regulator [Pseudomonas chlororaphis]|jgi:AraC-like DNA-binding protein|uniref:AraC family transcriptional regulator n=1 Tax=Pseudomonas morbosilactucae TaxID=2938197 RepID=A0A9X2C3C3_9PSED|nr:AraC family transcriptional regulator [Pseudomonas morbosilactucae]MCK9796582.1 AraC family transcriptional regulator [Pseudomonas morbosilactucae]MCK9813787.1 AraC family transcriptional regulator [Pseudomonas morbosilactucae]ROL69742.1 AraC family transcriptional regulator [Pseudomonas chlororaphis]WEK07300.1 MAG: AraC family transcriptional regulator [Pseudomonas sp.]